jgi:DNA-binding NarL/FixJ family response regulator
MSHKLIASDLRLKEEVGSFCRARSFSAREQDIILLLINGFASSEDIARRLKVSVSTVKNHLHSIFKKSKTKSKAELLAEFISENWNVASPTAKRRAGETLSIMVCDDDADFHDLVVQAMKKTGNIPAKIVFSHHGAELLEQLSKAQSSQKHLPDLILLDLNMPMMDGIETLQALKANDDYKDIPVITITNSDSEEDVKKSYSFGGYSYFVKPSSFYDLVEMMATITTYWSGNLGLGTTQKTPANEAQLVDSREQIAGNR